MATAIMTFEDCEGGVDIHVEFSPKADEQSAAHRLAIFSMEMVNNVGKEVRGLEMNLKAGELMQTHDSND